MTRVWKRITIRVGNAARVRNGLWLELECLTARVERQDEMG